MSACATSSRERAATAAISGGVGILKDESLAHQRVLVLEGGTVQVQKTLRVDEDAGAKLLEDFVAVAGLGVEAHGVGEARAAATLYADAQASNFRRNAFLFEKLAYFLRGGFGEVDGRRRR